MRFMLKIACRMIVLVSLPFMVGWPESPIARGRTPAKESKPDGLLAMGPRTMRDSSVPDPATMIPQPPAMLIPEIPSAPPRDTDLVASPKESVPAVTAGGNVNTGSIRLATATEAAESNIDSLHRVYRRASEKFNSMPGFECRLTRRETIGNKPMPEEVLQYRFRREPLSVHIKWIGLEAQGRELFYVQNKPDSKVHVVTGRGEGLLVPSGRKYVFAPTDSNIRSKSRHDIREGGMAMSIVWFGKVLAIMEKDPKQANRMRYVGKKPCRERESGMEAVEETIPPDWEPLLPRGGRRTTFFDPDPASPSFGLPILVSTMADNGREVEYYWFENLKPIRPSDADFDPDRSQRR
jgi:hypothetical protein